ncbi:hypothetical protein HYH03_005552 [Edaphochlamys debaryana]|uniref:DNA-(apurinic or apyrimidinic site) endonuclease n=1 Tax=Edaphochlamys debaryana TaxID=47281 RepID=A0A835Y553_9CHLO|nr:hypothetical protein HYH03_005552 [Edaphochlamys debaryana]|eukprot:KAG2496320.1 hypothetical protein HYH03_005552 [Edaphochlamys debaryana]
MEPASGDREERAQHTVNSAAEVRADVVEPVPPTGPSQDEGEVVAIMTWNINCLAPTVKNFELKYQSFRGFLDRWGVDIAAFQEVKLPAAKITRDLACVDGFQSFWATSVAKPGYSGVTTWCRTATCAPLGAAADCLGEDEQPELNREGRLVQTDHGAFVLLNAYVPNAGARETGRERLPFKLAFLRALRRRMDELAAEGRQVILVGDLNISASPQDAHSVLNWDTMYDPEEVAVLHGLIAAYPDVWRRLHPEATDVFTVWEERTSARAFNVGLRIDFVLASPGLLPYVQSCEVLTANDIPPKWSDHAAILLKLRVARQSPTAALAASPTTASLTAASPASAAALDPPSSAPEAAGAGATSDGQSGGSAEAEEEAAPLPRLQLPPPPTTPCAMWSALEARFVDPKQRSIKDLLTRKPAGGGAAGSAGGGAGRNPFAGKGKPAAATAGRGGGQPQAGAAAGAAAEAGVTAGGGGEGRGTKRPAENSTDATEQSRRPAPALRAAEPTVAAEPSGAEAAGTEPVRAGQEPGAQEAAGAPAGPSEGASQEGSGGQAQSAEGDGAAEGNEAGPGGPGPADAAAALSAGGGQGTQRGGTKAAGAGSSGRGSGGGGRGRGGKQAAKAGGKAAGGKGAAAAPGSSPAAAQRSIQSFFGKGAAK